MEGSHGAVSSPCPRGTRLLRRRTPAPCVQIRCSSAYAKVLVSGEHVSDVFKMETGFPESRGAYASCRLYRS